MVPGGPWAHVPAVLPGPGRLWAGGAPHALSVQVPAHAPRALLLDIQPERARPGVLTDFAAPPAGMPVHLQVLVNEQAVAAYDVRGRGARPAPARAPSHLRLAIPAAALGTGDPGRITLVNDRGGDLVLRRVRLAEARAHLRAEPLRAPRALARRAAPSCSRPASSSSPGAGSSTSPARPWRLAGPSLAGLMLGLAVVAPAAIRGVPRWAWLLLILGLVPWGRGRPGGRRAPADGASSAARSRTARSSSSPSPSRWSSRSTRSATAFRDDPWARSSRGAAPRRAAAAEAQLARLRGARVPAPRSPRASTGSRSSATPCPSARRRPTASGT